MNFFTRASHPNGSALLVPLPQEESEGGVLINIGNVELVH
jgi:hypothetical protein